MTRPLVALALLSATATAAPAATEMGAYLADAAQRAAIEVVAYKGRGGQASAEGPVSGEGQRSRADSFLGQACPGTVHMVANGVSKHFKPTEAEGKRWREVHPGLGLECRRADPLGQMMGTGQAARLSLSTLRDSRKRQGLAISATWLQKQGAAAGGYPLELGLGVGAHLFYRSHAWDPNSSLRWVPALLPTLTLDLPRLGAGLSMVAVPPVHKGLTPLAFVQFNYRLR